MTFLLDILLTLDSKLLQYCFYIRESQLNHILYVALVEILIIFTLYEHGNALFPHHIWHQPHGLAQLVE